MRTKYITLLACLVTCLLPVLVFGQSASTEDTSKLLQFLKGNGTFEEWFFKAFETIDLAIGKEASEVAFFGRAIAAIGATLQLAYIGWQMQSGDREWEIMPIIKPFLIGMIVINWSSFYSMIQSPFQTLASKPRAIFEKIEEDADVLRVKRFQKQNQLLEYAIKNKAEQKAKQREMDNLENSGGIMNGISSSISEGWDKLYAPIEEFTIRMSFEYQKLLGEFVEWIALAILRVCAYMMFFIQKIWSYILIVTGPIAVGVSLIPGFESSLNSWIAKFININLYSFVAYTIINIGQQIIMSAYTMEIDRYSKMIGANGEAIDSTLIVSFMTYNGMLQINMFTCVAYLITGIGLLMTPTIADSIVSAGGAMTMNKMKQNAGRMASAGKTVGKVGQAVATKGTSLAKDLAKRVKRFS